MSRAPVRHKVVLIGPSLAGKTSIIHRFIKRAFYEQAPTIGSAFYSREMQTDNGPICLQIWDTAGMERYKSLIPKYSKGASAAVVVFDITDELSFGQSKDLLLDAQANSSGKIECFFVANKIDLPAVVDVTDAREFADSKGAVFMETSAKSGQNIEELFQQIAARVALMQAPARGIELLTTIEKDDSSDVKEPPREKEACGC